MADTSAAQAAEPTAEEVVDEALVELIRTLNHEMQDPRRHLKELLSLKEGLRDARTAIIQKLRQARERTSRTPDLLGSHAKHVGP